MSDDSIICMKNAVPALVAVDTIWLALLSYWTSTKISELSCKIAKLEAENKTLKKRTLAKDKEQAATMKSVIETLKQHDKRLLKLNSGSKQQYKPPRSDRSIKVKHIEITPSNSSEEDSGVEGSDDEDLSGIYDAPKKRS